ncbi:MAG TPA: DNA repair protein RadA [Patescibacteria group bacterium]|nr:DNA repair protein RadA [Patescibacteria group bacterium]
MTKNIPQFECSNCGAQYTKWTGRCLECGKWGTVIEAKIEKLKAKTDTNAYSPATTVGLKDIQGKDIQRIQTGISELDRVLGGGVVPGSLILLGGEPGIGKSTLALQTAGIIPHTLYFSAEESVGQIKLRADRLGIKSETLQLANESNVETIMATIQKSKPKFAIVDSIQTIYSAEVEGEAGGPNQVRACATKLLEAAKLTGTALLLVGHVTKEGMVAGPKTLEHLVDTVLYLEGERFHFYRILRTVKNRFGSTDEVGIFQMVDGGLQEVKNPSATFLADRGNNTPGNVLACLMEGTRPILVEVQALVNKTAFGYPTRKASGFDTNRLHLLIAVLQRRAGLQLEQYDIHLNIAGGLTADEPAADLAVAIAIASAYKDKPLGQDLAVFGEVGLGGEIRPVFQTDKRIKECENLGLKRVITNPGAKAKISQKIRIIEVKNIQQLITHT